MLEFATIDIKEDRHWNIEHRYLYPGITHGSDEFRRGFIGKVYGILAVQMVLTTVVSFLTVRHAPIIDLILGNSTLLLFLIFLPYILLWPLYVYQQKHPLNFVFLRLFTASLSLIAGISWGKIMLEALISASAVVSSPSTYTFWAPKKGNDFSFLRDILLAGVVILLVNGYIQVFFPLGPATNAIIGGIGAVLFSGYIIYDIENMTRHFTYDEYIWASVTLYIDMVNFFISSAQHVEFILYDVMIVFMFHCKTMTRKFVKLIVDIE